jgi:hypothetical protein
MDPKPSQQWGFINLKNILIFFANFITYLDRYKKMLSGSMIKNI